MTLKRHSRLTPAGKRRGRRPKYLTDQHVEQLSAEVQIVREKRRAPRVRKSDTPFIIQKVLAERTGPVPRNQQELAFRLASNVGGCKVTASELEAMTARVRRVSGDGIDKMPSRQTKRRVSSKSDT